MSDDIQIMRLLPFSLCYFLFYVSIDDNLSLTSTYKYLIHINYIMHLKKIEKYIYFLLNAKE